MSVERTQSLFDFVDRTGIRMMPYLQVPKILLEDPLFHELSDSAILLYAVLLNRLELSLENNWFDEAGHAYVICTIKSIQKIMRCGCGKAVRLLQELDTERGFGLIQRARLGQGRPDHLYVKVYSGKITELETAEFSKSEVWSSENRKSGLSKTEIPGFPDSKPKKNYSKEPEENQPERKESRHRHGAYHNVFLSEEELETLKREFPTDYEERIESLSEYIASKGAKYKNHLATIRSWNRRERRERERRYRHENYETEDTL